MNERNLPLDKKNQVGVILVDVTKAIEATNHSLLMSKLDLDFTKASSRF